MKFIATDIPDLMVVQLERYQDERGSFARLFCRQEFAAQRLFSDLAQASLSVTRLAGTVRGMHFQRPPQAEVKLVRCVRGAIMDVVADLRPESPRFRQWRSFPLAPESDIAVCIPEGCAHGFQALQDDCEVLYQMSTPYAAGYADGVRFDDPALNIVWPREVTLINDKDRSWPLLAERAPPF